MISRQLFLAATTALVLSACATHGKESSGPRVLRSADQSNAMIRVCADKQGRPFDITMIQSSGNKDIDRAIIRAAKSWKFPQVNADGSVRNECEDVPVSAKLG